MSTLADLPPPWREDAALIGLVGLAHGVSHFCQLLLPPLFPWLKQAFGVGYTELGLLLSIFFTVSCGVQALAGFVVDRFGPRPVLFGGLALLGVSALGFATAPSYTVLALFSALAGAGNGVFHPVDYTLLNNRVGKSRLGHAYSVHGVTGSLGWAAAPMLLVPVAMMASWRTALLCAAAVAWAMLALLWTFRDRLQLPPAPSAGSPSARARAKAAGPPGAFDFLRIPAVWVCFAFFLFGAGVLSVVQSFAPEAARQLHQVPVAWVAACLSVYMVCSAMGMVAGGFLASDPERCERIVAVAFGLAATVALTVALAPLPALAVPALFGAMGFATGLAGPSRDLLVKQATPDGATGRVYGVVYSGLDIGQALTPLFFGALMDGHLYQAVWIGLAVLQLVLIATAFNVRRARRVGLAAA
jgi:MFS family permease